ncbi:hypothetical protein [Parasphingorhabdus cellanae]|uniref:DUF1579 domain-containing protein n=1 Tax=Parasphingorhabdus cellanae TaxID=2806553 RepID=A0ABX7T5L1_9SPHN|nr:hypothetical protein [Parasphingorhabdus cellanae]QTD55273.1 hypothetical protein J4G78_13750 [Parasphingorhabdus cellanae]
MILRLMMLLAAVSMVINPARAQDEQFLLEKFEGTWLATGNSFYEKAQSKMIWSKTLGDRFYRIDYSFSTRGNPEEGFSGIGHYRVADKPDVTGYWADNSGDLHPLNGKVRADRLRTIWGEAGSKQGLTEYLLLPDGALQVTDWLLTDDGWREFNKTTFQKQSAGQ